MPYLQLTDMRRSSRSGTVVYSAVAEPHGWQSLCAAPGRGGRIRTADLHFPKVACYPCTTPRWARQSISLMRRTLREGKGNSSWRTGLRPRRWLASS